MIEQVPIEDIYAMLGFFVALSLRRHRIQQIVGSFMNRLPGDTAKGGRTKGSGRDGENGES